MMNWSMFFLGLVAISSMAWAENSYLVIVPKLFKIGADNQVSVLIGAASQPVNVQFTLLIGQRRVESKAVCKPGETRNATLALPSDLPVGAGELTIVGTGGVQFEEKRDVIIYDDRHVILVQTSASVYRPGQTLEARVVVTDDKLVPLEDGLVDIEIYDASLKLVGEYPRFPIRSGLTETLRFPIAEHLNIGQWLVSATVGNTTSSVQVLVALPITPSFDLKAIFQRFLLRTEKTLRGFIELSSDCGEPIFGRAFIAVGQITEQDLPKPPHMADKPEAGLPRNTRGSQQSADQSNSMENGQSAQLVNNDNVQESRSTKPDSMEARAAAPEKPQEDFRTWKSQTVEVAGRIELNYDLQSLFDVDLTRALAVQVYIEVTDLASGQQRIIRHVIPVFTRDVVYDIRPLVFEAGIKNEFEVIAKRPDGKPAKMEDMIVTVRMLFPGEKKEGPPVEKTTEVKQFYTRGRNDIGLFNLEIPENCIGVLMMITPLAEDGQARGYRTHAVPLMPTPPRRGNNAKLSIELAPWTSASARSAVDASVVSTQVPTIGKVGNFYVQVLPTKPIEKFEPLPMSFVLLTNGKITLTGEFNIQPTKECQNKAPRTVQPEQPSAPVCVFNGTVSFPITREMLPYSTLLVFTFQPSFGVNVAETYRFSVAGLFQSNLTLNATVVPFTAGDRVGLDLKDMSSESSEEKENLTPVSDKAQGKSRVQLSFTGTPESTVAFNVFEYDATLHGLPTEITKERLIQYLTRYEQVPLSGMPTLADGEVKVAPRGAMDPVADADSEESRENAERADSTEQVTNPSSKMQQNKVNTVNKVPVKQSMGQNGMQMQAQTREVDSSAEASERATPEESDSQEHEARFLASEQQEHEQSRRERLGLKVRYPVEKLIFGLGSSRPAPPVEGDDAYLSSNMGRFYGEDRTQRLPQYRRKGLKSLGQYDVSLENNDFVIATSIPRVMVANEIPPKDMPGAPGQPPRRPEEDFQQQDNYDDDSSEQQQQQQQQQGGPLPPQPERPHYGTPAWFEKLNSKLSTISQEAFIFMNSGLSIVTDFESLRIPAGMQRFNMTSALAKFRNRFSAGDRESFDIRDDARQLIEEYIVESDGSLMPPPVMLEEQARSLYYTSVFFNSSRIGSQGTGKVVLPRTKPYSTWVATGFSLNSKAGLAIAQPIRLPTDQGLFVLANFPRQVQIGEHALLTYGVNNYLGKDLSNVIVRIRASADFDLIEQTQPERVASASGKDYTVTIPTLKTLGVETRSIVLVPKRAGVIKILIEVESEFGGDYELLTTHVRESGVVRKELSAHLYDLTGEKKTFGPIVERITQSPFLRYVKLAVSGSGLDRFVQRYTMETNSLIGVDRALVRLYRAIGLRSYLNATSQTDSYLFNVTAENITTAYQKLQLYADYNGSYSFISDKGTQASSLYLTALAFGAIASPWMPIRDNVTLNRTLNYILAHQQADGSFDDSAPCFHERFCVGEFRRETLTALVLWSLTHDNATVHMPAFIRRQLLSGEQSPINRAIRFLESRVPAIRSNVLVLTFVEVAFLESGLISEQLRQRIHDALYARQLTVVPEDGSKYLKIVSDKVSMDDQMLVNAMTTTLYAKFNDFKTASAIARYIVSQLQSHVQYDTIVDAIFHTDAWLHTDCLYRKDFGVDKFAVTIDVTTDNGQKKQFKIDAKNIDLTQKLSFKLPVQTVTYTVSGFGFVGVCLKQILVEKQPAVTAESSAFQLTQEFSPMPWLNEIKAKTCVTYTPTQQQRQFLSEKVNNTIVVEVQLPSGMRLNLRQIGFFLSRVEQVMHFTYEHRWNKLNFFLNVPWNMVSKPICIEWALERLSTVVGYAPIQVRAYDYVRPEWALSRLVPVQVEPALLGYSFVEAVIKARPTLETLANMQHEHQRRVVKSMASTPTSTKYTTTRTTSTTRRP